MIINDYKISLLSFKILNSDNEIINYITTKENIPVSTTINCVIYFPDDTKKDILNNVRQYPHIKYNFYSDITYKNRYIAMQRIEIPIDKLMKTSFMNLSFDFKVPSTLPDSNNNLIEVKNCNIKLLLSPKPFGEMGFSEVVRLGTFFETTVPVIKE